VSPAPPRDASCVFCKIVAGQIPCFKLLEDERTIAFMDINPANPGHALAVIKDHYPTIDAVPPEALGDVARTAQRVARAILKALGPHGLSLVQANGEGAAQSVPHLHIHIIPRQRNDGLLINWQAVPGDRAAIEAVYRKLLAAL
jgi:histidine triad (HIT) family protein